MSLKNKATRVKKQRFSNKSGGFTVIEVMLFLAISAGLIVALLATVGTTIARQRFSDSVASLQAFMQQQYNEVVNVTNDRGEGTCGVDSGGATSTTVGADSSIRGASGCVILGKAIDFTTEGSDTTRAHVVVRDVVGREPAAALAATETGAGLLKLYKPGVNGAREATYDIPWDAGVIGVTPAGVSRVLLLRSPDSGTVLSFGGNNGTSLDNALDDADRTYNICVKSADILNAVGVVTLLPVSGSEAVATKTYVNGTERANLCAA